VIEYTHINSRIEIEFFYEMSSFCITSGIKFRGLSGLLHRLLGIFVGQTSKFQNSNKLEKLNEIKK
jgi:hypothetical protein